MDSARTAGSQASSAQKSHQESSARDAKSNQSSARTAKSRGQFASNRFGSQRDLSSLSPRQTLEGTPYWALVLEEDWETIKVEAKRPEPWVTMQDESFGWTVGHFAANAGVPDLIKVLLDVRAKIDATDNEGNTMLMLCCRKGHVRAAEFLIGKKASLDTQNNNGWTALTWAAINGYTNIAELLLTSNADLLLPDKDGRTACMWAAMHGKMGIVEAFLSFGLNLRVTDHAGLTVLDHCQGHMYMSAMILALAEINDSLHQAAQQNDMDGVREAIEAGADLDMRDGYGWTPLMWAAAHGSLNMVQLVVRYGAKPSLLDECGELAKNLQTDHMAVGVEVEKILGANDRLLEAAQRNDWEAVEAELATGASINMVDESNRTSIMWAAKYCNAEAVNMLVDKSADINDRDCSGWTAAHFAVIERSPSTVSMLFYLGADMNIKTFEGDGLLHMAVRTNDAVMIQLVLAAGCDPEDPDFNLLTPLMMASYMGLDVAVSCLVAYSASLEAQSSAAFGERGALSLAVVHGQEEAVAALLRQPDETPPIPVEADGMMVAKASVAVGEGPPSVEETGSARPGKLSATTKEAASGVASKRKNLKKKKVDFKGDSPGALLNEAARRRDEQPWKTAPHPAKVAVKETDATGATPLALATRFRRTLIGTMLLQAKADPNAADTDGTTVLMEAVKTKQVEVVEYMIGLGVMTQAKNANGQKALDLCEDDVIKHLLYKKITMDKIPASDPKDIEMAEEREAQLLALAEQTNEYFRVRLENLPTAMDTIDLERAVRKTFQKVEAPNPKRINVMLDPITELPRGHAYADFLDAAAQDLAMRAHGEDINGYEARVYKEPLRPN